MVTLIPVTKPFLPPQHEYQTQIDELWKSKWITNNGVLVQRLEKEIADYLQISNLNYVTNGTMALTLALKALEITGEVITTPFSFLATSTSILWENCIPVFVDIDYETLCIDPNQIEKAITVKTKAIMATHVFGIPCDVEKIEIIAKKYNLKVIYDGAHVFGVNYKGKSILEYGDISTLSFHATKVFHTVEGGGIVCNGSDQLKEKVSLLRNYGFKDQEYLYVGINAKNSEFHAAMGLCNLKYIEENIMRRKKIFELYTNKLSEYVRTIRIPEDVEYNYAYYPVIFEDEETLLKVEQKLLKNNIYSRRYFYPSLNRLPYISLKNACPISEDISSRILCLPLYSELDLVTAENICEILNSCLVTLIV